MAASIAACGGPGHSGGTAAAQANADRLISAGLAAQRSGSAARAVKDFNAAVSAYPLDPYAYYDLGVVYQARGQLRRAAGEYQKALLI